MRHHVKRDAQGVDWTIHAACLDEDPDLFFPPGLRRSAAVQMEHARAVCMSCDVRVSCLELALASDAQYGVWGGTTPDDRKRIKRRAEKSAARRSSAEDRWRVAEELTEREAVHV